MGVPTASVTSTVTGAKFWPPVTIWPRPLHGESWAVSTCTAKTVKAAQFADAMTQALRDAASPALMGPAVTACVAMPLAALSVAPGGTLSSPADVVQVTDCPAAGTPLSNTRACGLHAIVAPIAR